MKNDEDKSDLIGRFVFLGTDHIAKPVYRKRLRRESINRILPLVEKKIIVDADSINLRFIQPNF